jgi:imidazoleglycerol-phosphate dehydratase
MSAHTGNTPANGAVPRPHVVERVTRETEIRVEIARGTGRATADTTQPFLDHMVVTLARYASLDLQLQARGDLKHHLIEDVGIVIGTAVAGLASPTVARYGDRTIPMDDALVQAVIDVGGRAYYEGPLPSRLYDHWMRSFSDHARATLHLRVLRGHDRHHVVEAAFKSLGLALRDALAEGDGVFSTKGRVEMAAGARTGAPS